MKYIKKNVRLKRKNYWFFINWIYICNGLY